MKVELDPSAAQEAEEMDAWWRANRPKAPDLFTEELADVKMRLATLPWRGSLARTRRGTLLRCVQMDRTHNQVFYVIDEPRQRVVILSIWGGPKGSLPNL